MSLLELPPDVPVVAAGLGLQRRVQQLLRDGRMHPRAPADRTILLDPRITASEFRPVRVDGRAHLLAVPAGRVGTPAR